MAMNEDDETILEAEFGQALATLNLANQYVEWSDGDGSVRLEGNFTATQLRGITAALDKVLAQG